MRRLIDGYNLMLAACELGKPLGPDGLRKARNRFLNRLAPLLGPNEAAVTTIVFDAAAAPRHLPRTSTHRGMTLIFADPDETADDRIESLIAKDPAPRALTVVSSDRRLRRAAERRRAVWISADAFWIKLDARRNLVGRTPPSPEPIAVPDRDEPPRPSAAEAAFWRAEFHDVDAVTAAGTPRDASAFIPTDDELERIAREVAREFGEDD